MSDLKPCEFWTEEPDVYFRMTEGGRMVFYDAGEGEWPGLAIFAASIANFRLQRLADAITNRRADGWVSVEDGLPESNGNYWTHPSGNAEVGTARWNAKARIWTRGSTMITKQVTHWCERNVPAPPEDTQ